MMVEKVTVIMEISAPVSTARTLLADSICCTRKCLLSAPNVLIQLRSITMMMDENKTDSRQYRAGMKYVLFFYLWKYLFTALLLAFVYTNYIIG